MSSLTISVDDEVLRRARLRALDEGTSVNALLRDYLTAYASGEERVKATEELLASSRRARSRRGATGRTRDELHVR